MSTQKLEDVLAKVFEKYTNDEVLAVYVTGSCLNNLMTETSDIDLYVVLKQSKRSLVFGQFLSSQEHGENDFKFLESFKFVQLIYKTNPNMLELFFKYPIYVHEEFKPLADFLYENKNELLRINLERYFSACYHMLKNNYNKLKNDTGKVVRNMAGKEALNFYKVYNQAVASAKQEDLTPYVQFSGVLKEEMMAYKMKKGYSQDEKTEELLKMEKCLQELEQLKNEYQGYEVNEKLFENILEFL